MGEARCLWDVGEDYQISAEDDGSTYQLISGDCVIEGIGDEFTINYSDASLNISFQAGSKANVGGGFWVLEQASQLTLTESSELFICARVNKEEPYGQRASIVALTSSQISHDDLNSDDGTKRDLILYKVITSESGVSSVIDMRYIKGSIFKKIATLNIIGTPIELDTPIEEDVNSEFTKYLDIAVQGINEDDQITNMCYPTDFGEIFSGFVDTMEGKLRFYLSSECEEIEEAIALTNIRIIRG